MFTQFADAAEPFSPANSLYKRPSLEASVPETAYALLEKFDAATFRTLCQVAVIDGYTSRQVLREKFGDALPRNVEKLSEAVWPVPNPATMRRILEFLATTSPDHATGSTLPWRHAQCVQPEGAPKLPNSPRMVGAHLRR